jgi:hypothetical protein
MAGHNFRSENAEQFKGGLAGQNGKAVQVVRPAKIALRKKPVRNGEKSANSDMAR